MAKRTWHLAASAMLVTPLLLGAVPYEIELEGVQEVCLYGRADRSYWEDVLRPEALQPAGDGEQVEVSVCGFASRWLWFDFGEAIFSVAARTEDPSPPGWFLVRALNSLPFFAWVERVRNQAPYRQGEVVARIGEDGATLAWREGDRTVLEAKLNTALSPLTARSDTWAGPVYLPRGMTPEPELGRYFLARLSGDVESHPFVAGRDTFTLGASADSETARFLRGSRFVPTEWRIKRSARHAKTASLRR